MSLTSLQKLDVLAAHYARRGLPDEVEWARFVQTVRANEAVNSLRRRFAALDALPLARRLTLTLACPSTVVTADDFLADLTEDGTVLRWRGESVGERRAFVRTVLPQEAQVRLAYESLLTQFLDYLQGQRRILPLADNGVMVELFVPDGAEVDLDAAWEAFIPTAFSWEALERSFLLLVNSLKLTNRGFGYVNFPPVTSDMARLQAAFYLATLQERLVYGHEGFKAANTRVAETQRKLSEQREALSKAADERQRTRVEQRIVDLEATLAEAQEQRDNELTEACRVWQCALVNLEAQLPPKELVRLQELSRAFNRTARQQFSYGTVKPAAGKTTGGNSIEDMIVRSAQATQFHTPSPLLHPAEAAVAVAPRPAGDDEGDVCYGCGRPIPREQRGFTANRFILGDPSQRLQSGSGQVQPSICFDCAAVSVACPVKLTESAAVIRLGGHDNLDPGTEDFVRMLALGELNLVAGRYLLLNCREIAGTGNDRKPMTEAMGALQYALYKLATTLPRETLRRKSAWLVTGGREIPLLPRHLVALSILEEIFRPQLVVNSKPNVPLLTAVRLVQRDLGIHALYELIAGRAGKPYEIHYGRRELRLMEDYRRDLCRMVEAALYGKEEEMAEDLQNRAELYRDVAALTGLLYPFCRNVEIAARNTGKDAKREVGKLIEEVTDPYRFLYRTTHNYGFQAANLTRTPAHYFCFEEAVRLLTELGVDVAERERLAREAAAEREATAAPPEPTLPELPEELIVAEAGAAEADAGSDRLIRVYFDDVRNAYTTLLEKETYSSPKQQAELTTELKLSLCAKFPAYFVRKKGEE